LEIIHPGNQQPLVRGPSSETVSLTRNAASACSTTAKLGDWWMNPAIKFARSCAKPEERPDCGTQFAPDDSSSGADVKVV
jgi:hypothetical protein